MTPAALCEKPRTIGPPRRQGLVDVEGTGAGLLDGEGGGGDALGEGAGGVGVGVGVATGGGVGVGVGVDVGLLAGFAVGPPEGCPPDAPDVGEGGDEEADGGGGAAAEVRLTTGRPGIARAGVVPARPRTVRLIGGAVDRAPDTAAGGEGAGLTAGTVNMGDSCWAMVPACAGVA